MDKVVEIVSSEIIKPSCPTPESLRIFKLSFFEQIGLTYPFVSIILFYAGNSEVEYSGKTNRLKKSLSHALNHDCMYPLAGRIKDAFSIDCNDEGALFTEALVNNHDISISTVVKHPKLDFLKQLLPPDPIEITPNPCDRVLLSVQVNQFSSGGIAIGVSVSHAIVDASALSTFLKNWASLAREEEESVIRDGLILDCTTIFPPRDYNFLAMPTNKSRALNTKATRFVFNNSNIALLREKIARKGLECTPTRFNAVSAFIWGAIISKIRESGKFNPFLAHIMCSAVNLRKRIIPPLPLHSLGSIAHVAVAVWTATDDTGVEILARKVGESITKMNVKKMHAGDEYFNSYMTAIEKYSIGTNGGQILLSSWCRFPFYETDFGWGKPLWASVAEVPSENIILMDASDGEGIEAWIGLPKDDMTKLEQDRDFLSYVSSTHSL